MSKRELVPNRQYTDEFRVEAVRLAESIGGNKAAKRLGIPDSSLWNWLQLSRAGKLKATDGMAVPVKRSLAEAEAENARLRRELASTKLDLEIVKKRRRISRRNRGEIRLDRRTQKGLSAAGDVWGFDGQHRRLPRLEARRRGSGSPMRRCTP